MKQRFSTIRVLLVVLCVSSYSVPAFAACYNYECRVSTDTAQCYIRYGPNARFFQSGSDCREVASCGWHFSAGTWDNSCSYSCNLTECYEV